MLGVLWAVEGGLKPRYDGYKHFKWLRKLTGPGGHALR
jgi:hypothetical protein